MPLILLIILAAIIRKATRAARTRPRGRPRSTAATVPAARLARNLAALDALQQQRDIYNDLISEYDYLLSKAPPDRAKLLNQKAMLYSKLATVETKINKLTG